MTKRKPHILAIPGSPRKRSSNLSILKGIKEKYASEAGFDIFEGLGELPHFNPDMDNENLPTAVKSFREKIEAADGVLFCSPEYVFSLPGSLKNALDWLVSTTIFSGKPTAFIIAAASGKKAFESLDLILTTIEAKLAGSSKLLIPGAGGKVNNEGVLEDEMAVENIDLLVRSLLKSIEESS